jgi:hypothetical protein
VDKEAGAKNSANGMEKQEISCQRCGLAGP